MKYCKKCGDELHEKRAKLGYDTCVKCSTEPMWSGVPVINHKTGNEIQVVKDPEVAKEFMELSNRKGFTAFQGRDRSKTKDETIPSQDTHREKQIDLTRVLSRKLDTSLYDDEGVSKAVIDIAEKDGAVAARKFLETEFRSLHVSAQCRKRLLQVIDTFSR